MWFKAKDLCEGGQSGDHWLLCLAPPTKFWVTEPDKGRTRPLQGHTTGPNNTYSTGQTVNQNNFIVSKIEIESKAETCKGRGQREGREDDGRESVRVGVCGKVGD